MASFFAKEAAQFIHKKQQIYGLYFLIHHRTYDTRKPTQDFSPSLDVG